MLRPDGGSAALFDDVIVTASGLRLEEPWPMPSNATAARLEWTGAGAGLGTSW
jgi:hypothetical protein